MRVPVQKIEKKQSGTKMKDKQDGR